jgi:hypothetical protein
MTRIRHLSDQQILEASFKLADAQELVARQMVSRDGMRSNQELTQ